MSHIPSSKQVLPIRVVRPPKVDETGRLIKASVPTSSAVPYASPSKPSPPSLAASSPASKFRPQSARAVASLPEFLTSAVREASRDLAMPSVAAWPVQGGQSRLVDVLQRLARSMDGEQSPVVRADYLVQSFLLLSKEMHTFQPFFDAYAAEVQQLVSRFAEAREQLDEAEQRMTAQQSHFERIVQDAQVKASHEVRALSQQLEDNRMLMKRVEEDADRFRQMQADLERDKKLFAVKEQEAQQLRRVQEQMSVQFSARNKALQDSIPPLEEEARLQRIRAEDAIQSNQRLAHKLGQQEKAFSRTVHQLQQRIDVQTATIEELTTHNRRLAASIQVLRGVKDQAVEECASVKQHMQDLSSTFETKLRSLTPRPDPDARVEHLVAKSERTRDRFAVLSACVAESIETREELTRENFVMRESLLVCGQADSTPGGLLQVGVTEVFLVPSLLPPAVEPQVYAFPGNDAKEAEDVLYQPTNAQVPYIFAWPSGVSRVTCKACTLPEMSMRCRDLLDHCASLQSRTTRHVELHVSLLVFFLDGAALGEHHTAAGHYPVQPARDACRISMAVFENCLNVVRAADVWASEPVLRLFGCILREEVGPWWWGHQKRLVTEIMCALSTSSAGGSLRLGAAWDMMDSHLVDWPMSVKLAARKAVAATVQHQHRQVRKEGRQQGAAPPQLPLHIRPDTLCRIEWDKDAVLESALLRRLRVILLEGVLSFYQRFEQQLFSSLGLAHGRAPSYDAAQALSVSFGLSVEVLLSVCPALDVGTAQQYIGDVFDLGNTIARSEAAALRNNTIDYIGPSSGPAASQLFVSGLTQTYFGSFRPYPKLLSQHALSNRKQNKRTAQQASRKSVSSQPRKSASGSVTPQQVQLVVPQAIDEAKTPMTPTLAAPVAAPVVKPLAIQKSACPVLPLVLFARVVRKIPLPPQFGAILDAPPLTSDL